MSRALTAARILTVVALLGGAGWYGALAVADARVLHVSDIRLRGNRHLSRGEVMALLSGLHGQHLLHTDLEVWRRRVQGSPWVEQAALRRVLPSTVEVVVRERTPMAVGRIRGELYLVDEHGVVIDEFGPNYAQFDLPIVDGLADVKAGEIAVDPQRAALAAALLTALARQPDLLKQVSQIDVANPHDAVLVLDGDPALVHLGETQFVERLQRYFDLRAALLARVPVIEYVDLRFDDRVYVRPVKGAMVLRPTAEARP